MEAGTQVITAALRVVCSHAPRKSAIEYLADEPHSSLLRDQVSVKARNAFLSVWPCFVFVHHEAVGYQ